MRALGWFLFSVACTAFVVYMEWPDLAYCNPNGACVLELGRVIMAYLLIGGGTFAAYQFSKIGERS